MPDTLEPNVSNSVAIHRLSMPGRHGGERDDLNDQIQVDVESINDRLASLQRKLNEKSDEGVEDGAIALTESARVFVLSCALEIWLQEALTPRGHLSDVKFVAFVRDNGGACLVADCEPTRKRFTAEISPDGAGAEVAKTGPIRSHDETRPIESADHIVRFLGWLTRPESQK
jgi:hypothetical protein